MGTATVEPGDVVADKYRVERVIGRGGMGIVLGAVDIKLGKRVALKCLLPHAWGNAAAVARFEREARASVALESEHVCRVLDVGRMPDGAPFIAMELLDGMDLAHEMHRRGGRLPIADAVAYVIEACDAISEAHAHGIIHRDLKPSNLFLAKRAHREPIIKVLDFGISKPTAVGQIPSALTGTADLLGSPLYMSPEQLRAPKTVDARSDVWSLAATLYELVSGKPPFEATTIADLASRIMNAPAPDVRQRVPSAPAGFAEVIMRALAKSPDARYATAADFARALAPFGHAKRTVPMPAISPPASKMPPSSTKLLTAPITPRDANRTLPLAPGSAPALPVAAAPSPVPAAPASDPSVATKAPSPAPVHSLSGPLGIVGSLVAAIVIVVVVVVTRTKDDSKTAPVASASASVSAASATASAESPPIASASSATASSPDASHEEDAASPSPSASAAVEPAPPWTPPPQPVRPPPSASALPDARVFESAGY